MIRMAQANVTHGKISVLKGGEAGFDQVGPKPTNLINSI